ncbi:glycosyltransferase [Palleronia rufa]|uniref:glycosyltransferase n=1 Tax=Palleronia rufa TaxID=1530186 RepID=UPI00068E07C8|nr:glycosyltransferase family 2 protein [Palleronia rufa]
MTRTEPHFRIGPAAESVPEAPLALGIVVPVFKEVENVGEMVRRLDTALEGIAWEVIFVDDDSPDGTADAVRKIGRRDRRVRCLQRIGRRGLASACVEGMLATSAPVAAVIDGDLQHDETLLPRMLDAIRMDEADIVVGSRYVAQGGVGNWDRRRVAISGYSNALARRILGVRLSDPMSGFFMLRRDIVHRAAPHLSEIGFKILLDIVVSLPSRPRIVEIPYEFRARVAGESKLDPAIAWEFGMMLVDKIIGRYIPARFVSFAAVGGSGIFVHFAVLSVLYGGLSAGFAAAQTGATLVAIAYNFFLNNILTYRDRRLEGAALFRGLATFYLACGIGVVANIGVATYVFENNNAMAVSALAGIVVGSVWNYVITSIFTWQARR